MARANLLVPAIKTGEISPKSIARIDLQQYPFAAETLENFYILNQGGLTRRAGSRFVTEVKDSTVLTALLAFQFNIDQSYPIEVGNEYLRFYKDQAALTVADTDAAITNGTFDADITSWTDLSGTLELGFDAETGAFTPGLTVTGGTSGHSGTIVAVNKGVLDSGDYGFLTISGATGTFQDNEALTDTSTGAATANRAVAPYGTSATIAWSAARAALRLNGATDDYAWAEQSVTTSNTNQEHVLVFNVYGPPSTIVEARVGELSTANNLIEDRECGVGWHAVAFTPTVSPFFIQFRHKDDTHCYIDDVSLIDNAALELPTPYQTADVEDLRTAQVADVMYIANENYHPYKLLRYGHTSWSLQQPDFNGPWMDPNTTATTLTPSATSGVATITASRVQGINDNRGFLETDIGRQVRIQHSTTWGNALIATFTSATEVGVIILTDFGAATAQVNWALGSWSDTTGYPKQVVFHEGRLVFANSTAQPQTFWMSQSQDFENMQPDSDAGAIEDDDAIIRTIASKSIDSVGWATTGPYLTFGTAGGAWIVRSNARDEALTPANFNAKKQGTTKSSDREAVQIDDATLYIQRGLKRLSMFGVNSPDVFREGFMSVDLTRLADHIANTGFEEIQWQEEPYRLVLARRTDGQVAALSFDPNQERVGWSRLILGGVFGSGDAVVESVAVIPGNAAGDSTDRDEVWLIVKRTIDGGTVRYIEFFEGQYQDDDDHEDAFYVDCGLTYDGAATDTITGLDHLEGETVSVLADGATHADATVASGQITLDADYSVVQVGLSYTSLYKSVKAEGGAVIGPAMTQTKRIGRIGLVLDNTLGLKIGPDADTLADIAFREVDDPMDTAVPLFTGEKEIDDFPGEWETDPRIVIESSAPQPATILGLVPQVDTQDNL